MRPITFRILLILISVLLSFHTYGQTCTGSLGDPIIKVDFGAGPNPGPALSGQQTNMTYLNTSCPNDGQYTIANSSGNCFGDAWVFLNQDHTGNPNGYMMIINASNLPSIFFTQQTNVGDLCPNTKYYFEAYITNLNLPTICSGNPILPNITFTIETTGGVLLAPPYNTGDIPATGKVDWKPYGTFFTTPANSNEAIVVKMQNNAPGGCGNDFALDDITFRACGPVIVAGIGSTGGPQQSSLCQGDNGLFNFNTTVVGDDSPVYQWQSNVNNAGWTDITGETTASLQVPFSNAVTGVYQYRVGIANGSNITSPTCRVYGSPLTVTVNPYPVVPAIANQTVCETYPVTLTASGGASYTWTGPGMQPTAQNPLVINSATPANTGTYTVVALSDKGCSAPPVQTYVNVIPKIVPGVSPDVTICAGETTQLSSSGGKYYKWVPSNGLDHPDTPNPVASPLQTTTYTVHISNDGCADSSKTVTVTVNQNPVANAGNNRAIFEGQSVKLDGVIKGDNITGFFWSPSTFLDDPKSLTPVATPTDDITYTLNLTSLSCGTSSSNVFVRVYKKITIPNAFSPNNDGTNDYWNINALITYPDCSLVVYNRYGQQVYQSTGYSKPWDGTYNGSLLPPGTYYYILDLKNNTPKISGWVVVVR
ncbi:gliding motility-associated C-terminal domain-containing protein [Mucilaginibacter gotjawali]|uniref:Gliding motility-associated-like protein n=1 Tax=Mucilaginibacter gotjawali TaxID=1550579 RepID=A0A839SNW9_9SPHI|nr:gliding motility-associated C-terminal domain-containing protein [Mucilaginibacter gotjawali]MBB3058904.1 gliding motility-associated-like protein [Mucilaginibacter gotjawali]